jgi:hypothetical protein
MGTPEEDAKRYFDKVGKEKALEIIKLAIDSMVRSCAIKRHTKLIKKELLKM